MLHCDYRVFTSPLAKGNPAAVVILDAIPGISAGQNLLFPYEAFLPTSQLQAIAKETNIAMTIFALPLESSTEESTIHYAIRWFDKFTEIPLCGHATVALSAHLFNTIADPPQMFRYLTRRYGIISASQHRPLGYDSAMVGIEFSELTDLLPVANGSERWLHLQRILDPVDSSLSWAEKGEPVGIFERDEFLLLEYPPELDLKALEFDLKSLSSLQNFTYMFQISTTGSAQICTRVFNTIGYVREDIATGSAQRAVVPYALSNPETKARLKLHHPDFEGDVLQVSQLSPEGGAMTAQWLRSQQLVRVMGEVDFFGKGEISV